MNEVKITANDENKLISKFLVSYYNLPYSLVMKAFRNKDVRINGVKTKDKNYKLKKGDVIVTYFKEVEKPVLEFMSLKKEFDILYEDKNILVVNKPAKLPTYKEKENNLRDQVLTYLKKTKKLNTNSTFTPSNIHQLDMMTTGCVIFALNYETLRTLQDAMSDHSMIEKEYVAMIKGEYRGERIINKPLSHDEENKRVVVSNDGKDAVTRVEPIAFKNGVTMLKIILESGRKHQIRVHLSSIGYPVLGDWKYGKSRGDMCLCAKSITFSGFEGTLEYLNGKTISCELPSYMQL